MKCANCEAEKMIGVRQLEKVTVGRSTFVGMVSGLKCPKCKTTALNGLELEDLELRAAVTLAKAGEKSGQALRFMRKVLGLKAKDLAELLDLSPEHLSRMERGRQGVEHTIMALVGSMVLNRLDGRTVTFDALRALHHPRKLAKRVELNHDSKRLAS